MDALRKEIERKRKEREELEAEVKRRKAAEEAEADDKPKKYIRRGELEKERERKYLEELEAEKKLKEAKQRELQKQVEVSKPKKNTTEEQPEDTTSKLPLEEIFKRLRARKQPITLFGETDKDRIERLRKLEEREPVDYMQVGTGDEFGQSLRQLNKTDEASTTEEKNEEEEEEKLEVPSDNVKTREDFCYELIKRYLKEWGRELDGRTEIQKRSAAGKIDTVTYKQCRSHIKPLFRSLQKRDLPSDLLNPIHEICQFLEKKEYVRAHDAYLRMAIGNAPWPMGVTMVGIHERSSREKIFSNQIAHVLNDETQRKYIQALKRIMSFVQRAYPADPSKTVG